MPITYEIDHERRLVVAKPHGLLTDGEMFNYQRELGARSNARSYDELIDMSGVTGIDYVSADRFDSRSCPGGRIGDMRFDALSKTGGGGGPFDVEW